MSRLRRGCALALLGMLGCSGGASEPTSSDDATADTGADSGVDAITPSDGAGTDAAPEVATDAPLFPIDDGGIIDYPLPPIPTTCTRATVLAYAPNGYARLLDALAADATACADYFIHVAPEPLDKTQPRGATVPSAIRSRAGRFHAVAEFNWAAWSASSAMTWLEKGVAFRNRMEKAGYNVARGDTWAIVELPATVRTDATLRGNVRDLLHGLHAGDIGATPRAGFTLLPQIAQGTNLFLMPQFRTQSEAFLSDAAFWTEIAASTIGFGQEAWLDPSKTCVNGATIASLAAHVNAYAEYPAVLAGNGPAGAATARTTLAAAYFPVINGAYLSSSYFTSSLPMPQMLAFASLQIYATRSFGDTHPTPGRRVGFVWDETGKAPVPADLTAVAARLAAAIRGAYDPAGTAALACSPTGATTSCICQAGGAFNDAWTTYSTW